MTYQDLIDALKNKYCSPEWALMFEVANGTGHHSNRHADAVAMNLYPSRGLALHGFEIKVSRGDWLRELKQPAKAEAIASYCDHWWLVVNDKEIVKPGELPLGWGLLVPRGDALVASVAPAIREGKAIDRKFTAAILRKVTDPRFLDQAMSQRINDLNAEHEKRIRERVEQHGKYQADEFRSLKNAVKQFEDSSGISINTWQGDRIGAIVKVLLRDGAEEIKSDIGKIHNRLAKLVAELEIKL